MLEFNPFSPIVPQITTTNVRRIRGQLKRSPRKLIVVRIEYTKHDV